MSPIRVLHCIETLHSGGVEQRRLVLARHLDPARFEQQIICTQSKGPLRKEFEDAGAQVHEIGRFRKSVIDPVPYLNARKIVRSFRPHIIHGAVFGGTATAVVAGKLSRVPMRIAEETSDPANRSWRGDLLIRALYAGAHRVVGISPDVIGYLDRIGVPRDKQVLINNGVQPPRKLTQTEVLSRKAELGLTDDDFVVGFAGRLVDDHKRVSDLIEAVALLLPEQHRRIRLLIVGDGADKSVLEALAADRGIADLCRFVGYQRDTAAFYALMDLFVLASQREGFGLVVAEAMLAGTPVVATRVGGVPSVLDDGRAGLLVSPRAPHEIAAAIRTLQDDPSKRRELAERAEIYARAHHTAERYAADVARLYEELVAEKT